ncbi:sulfatase-like hydrolase/transferase [Catenovulum maritimum]|uniref:Sulfatase n=1 Tax=Catenovulum maritimum TaxID=1513271 RepID=A0A0J8GNR6_9ALTE|nr:sulfatase-like hydrolase/transferase [Catenovulum maritimum]KMT64470.1 sulfatase [Catenovulum maritimum]
MQLLNKKHLIFVLLTLVLGCESVATPVDDSRPNILFILTDDMGYADVSFNGSKDIQTPSLDELAEGGITFSAAYMAHPFCGPSRTALMTGRYPHKIGSQFNLPNTMPNLGVPKDETFISTVLQKSGYFTGVVGKWHIGEGKEFHPNQRGFDEFYGFTGGGHDYFPERFNKAYNNLKARNAKFIPEYLRPLEHNGVEVEEQEYITDALSREAVNFINKAAKKDDPFFLYLAYNAPHTPMQALQKDMDMFPHITDQKRKVYAGMVYAVDRGVARIVEALKQNKQFENTLIVFASDNGGKPNTGANNYPLKGRKGDVHEGGYRTPMFFHWPKQIKPNQKNDFRLLSLDLYPTFAALGEAKIPEGKKLDGKNVFPHLMNGTDPHAGEASYTLRHRGYSSDASARRDNWKAVKTGDNNWVLYDIEKDIAETTDVSAQHPDILRDLVLEMEGWSWSNQEPLWFHNTEEGYLWRKEGMPKFHETFKLK